MSNWTRYDVDLGDDGKTQVEARETTSGSLEWRGIANTTFESWQGGAHRVDDQTIAEQVQDAAEGWFHGSKIS